MIVKKLNKKNNRDGYEFVIAATRDELKIIRSIAGLSCREGLNALCWDGETGLILGDIYMQIRDAKVGMSDKIAYK